MTKWDQKDEKKYREFIKKLVQYREEGNQNNYHQQYPFTGAWNKAKCRLHVPMYKRFLPSGTVCVHLCACVRACAFRVCAGGLNLQGWEPSCSCIHTHINKPLLSSLPVPLLSFTFQTLAGDFDAKVKGYDNSKLCGESDCDLAASDISVVCNTVCLCMRSCTLMVCLCVCLCMQTDMITQKKYQCRFFGTLFDSHGLLVCAFMYSDMVTQKRYQGRVFGAQFWFGNGFDRALPSTRFRVFIAYQYMCTYVCTYSCPSNVT